MSKPNFQIECNNTVLKPTCPNVEGSEAVSLFGSTGNGGMLNMFEKEEDCPESYRIYHRCVAGVLERQSSDNEIPVRISPWSIFQGDATSYLLLRQYNTDSSNIRARQALQYV